MWFRICEQCLDYTMIRTICYQFQVDNANQRTSWCRCPTTYHWYILFVWRPLWTWRTIQTFKTYVSQFSLHVNAFFLEVTEDPDELKGRWSQDNPGHRRSVPLLYSKGCKGLSRCTVSNGITYVFERYYVMFSGLRPSLHDCLPKSVFTLLPRL